MKTVTSVKHTSGTLLSICGFVLLALLAFTTAKTAVAGPSPLDTYSTVANCDTRYWVPGTHAGIVYGPGHEARLACNEEQYIPKCHYLKDHKCTYYRECFGK